MSWTDEINVKTKSVSDIITLLCIIVNLENFIKRTSLNRFSYNSKVAYKDTNENLLFS
jgi:hypothetical protein